MMAKITGNKSSLQIIIPKDLCETYHLRAGDRVAVREDSRGILILKNNQPGIQTGVWTVGYEGLSLRGFVNMLKVVSIEQVVDVRQLPLSRKNGFSKSALKQHLEINGIDYYHLPELGTPRNMRHDFKNGGSREQFLKSYKNHLDKNLRTYQLLRGLSLSRRTAIMCFEKDHSQCHRAIIADRLKQDGFGLVHL